MKLADPQELSLHNDQAPDRQPAPCAISKEMSQSPFCHYDVFALLLRCSLRLKRRPSNDFRHIQATRPLDGNTQAEDV